MGNYVFTLAKTTGFDNNWGYVRTSGTDTDFYVHETNLMDNEILFMVDDEAFSKDKALEIATEKAEELYGKPTLNFDKITGEQHNER